MSLNQKVCLFGGTFNPIHVGHIELAKAAYEQLELNQIIWIPSGISYFKNQNQVMPAKHRMEMVKIGIKEYPYMSASAIEIEREGNSYFYETLEYFKKKNPNTSFYFLLGADCLFEILKWKNYEFIFHNCILVTAIRNGISVEKLQNQCSFLKTKYNANIAILNFNEMDISSTQIRNSIKNKSADNKFLNDAVLHYISEYHLFNQMR